MVFWGKGFTLAVSFFLSLVAPKAQAFDCYTDCGTVASFKYPCPTLSNPHRRCTGREPGTFAACQTTKVAACNILLPLKNQILHKMVTTVASDVHVEDVAGGWTRLTCATAGAGLITAVNAGYSAPICAAMNVAAAGCVTFVVASGGVITGGVCAQLCADHRLADCH
jgi:hypothetical protein